MKTRLAIDLYAKMILEFPADKERMNCRFIGLMPGEYLVIRVPLLPGIKQRLVQGNSVELRFLHQGRLVGFKTEVLVYQPTPFSLMFVRYPHDLEQHDLRRERRMECRLATSITKDEVCWQGVTVDISKGGCNFMFDAAVSGNPALNKGDSVSGAFQIMGAEEEHSFHAVVASLGNKKGRWTMGLTFSGEESAPSEKVYQYLKAIAQVLG